MRLSAREEIVVELFRKLHVEQRNELVRHIRSIVDANHEIERRLGRPLKPVSNERVAARFGKVPPPTARGARNGHGKPKPRRPDRNQDDNQ